MSNEIATSISREMGETALIIVDVQNDFCEGGAVPVKGATEMIKTINKIKNSNKFNHIFLSQDFHPKNHCSFASNHEGKKPFEFKILKSGKNQYLWPDHCIQHSEGAKFHPDLIVKDTDVIVQKGLHPDYDSYSAFKDDGNTKTALDQLLKDRNVTTIYLCGLALDYCVRYTAFNGIEFGYETYIITDASRAVDEEKTRKKLTVVQEKGIKLIESKEFLE